MQVFTNFGVKPTTKIHQGSKLSFSNAADGGGDTLVVENAGGDIIAECKLECRLSFFEKVKQFFDVITAYISLFFLAFSLVFE